VSRQGHETAAPPARRAAQRRGLTVVETLVTLAITSILAAILVPTLGHARRSAAGTGCAANLQALGHAVAMYRADHRDLFPWATVQANFSMGLTQPFAALAPYLDVALPRTVSDDPDRRFNPAPPLACPLDHQRAPRKGVSYVYLPSDLMFAWPGPNQHRAVSHFLERRPFEPLMRDALPWHDPRAGPSPLGVKGCMVLRVDGGVEPGTPR